MRYGYFVFLAALILSAPAAAQVPQAPQSSLLDAFHGALLACAPPGGAQETDLTSFCVGVRFGALDVYAVAAERCSATRSEADCAEARHHKEYIEKLLRQLSR